MNTAPRNDRPLPTAQDIAELPDDVRAALRASLAAHDAGQAGKPADLGPLVKVYNKGQGTFTHGAFECAPASFADVPQVVADLWCSHKMMGQPAVVLASEMPNGADNTKENALVADLTKANAEAQAQIENLRKLLAAAQTNTPVVGSEAPVVVPPAAEATPPPAAPAPKKNAGKG